MRIRYEILEMVCKNPAITFKEILNKITLSKGSLSVHLKNLENEKLIIKYKDLNQKNLLKVRPTKSGVDMYIQIKLNKILKKI